MPAKNDEHAILWQITPREEFAKDGASYVFLKDTDPVDLPPNSFATLIAHTAILPDELRVVAHEFTDPDLNGVSLLRGLLGRKMPFVTRLQSLLGSYYLLIEVTPMSSPENARVTIEGSGDLVSWAAIHTFELAPDDAPEFFRTSIARP